MRADSLSLTLDGMWLKTHTFHEIHLAVVPLFHEDQLVHPDGSQLTQLLLGHVHEDSVLRSAHQRHEGSLANGTVSRVFLGDPHRIAIQHFREQGSERRSLYKQKMKSYMSVIPSHLSFHCEALTRNVQGTVLKIT